MLKEEDLNDVTSFIGEFVRGEPGKLKVTICLDKTQLIASQLDAGKKAEDVAASNQAASDEIECSQTIDWLIVCL